jgi:nucleotide-binding universal stress UspA family protein
MPRYGILAAVGRRGGPLNEQECGEILAKRLSGWQEHYPDVRVRRRIVPDRPAARLIEESARAQLVVLGSRGRGGFARLLLGSVSTSVAESSTAPLVVLRAAQRS